MARLPPGPPPCKVLSTTQGGVHQCMLSHQLCPTLYDAMDCSPPGSFVHEILQARILECIATFSSRGSSQSRDPTLVAYVSCISRRVLYH